MAKKSVDYVCALCVCCIILGSLQQITCKHKHNLSAAVSGNAVGSVGDTAI